jgi:hypothetical protein|tara:strand:- start:207 stop:392 length:186 start_codon:yes stop_codon:yes gene_type:complete
MDDYGLGVTLRRVINSRKELIVETLTTNALKDMNHYASLQGELMALNLIEAEIQQFYKESK